MELAPSLQAACERWPDRPAITFAGVTMTYAELMARVSAVAASYRRLGVAPGDRVVCALVDRPEHIVAMNAAWAVGAIHVGTDADLTGGEMAWLVDRTEAAAVIVQREPGTTEPGTLSFEIGEIVFGARQPVLYWRNPEVATDGWYHTGDLGRVDADGRLDLEGRLKELLNRGGLNVSPAESRQPSPAIPM